MYVVKRNGKFVFTERYNDPMTGKLKSASVTLEKNTNHYKKMAREILADKIKEKLKFTGTEDITISELVRRYQEDQSRTVTKSTYTRNVFATNALARILGGDVIANRLSAGYVRDCFNRTGESNGTLNERLKRFKALIRWGYRNDLIDDIRYIDKLTPYGDKEKAIRLKEKFLERDELKKLLQNIAVTKWRMLSALTALSGLRIGEAIALEQKDVDFKNRIISVNKTVDIVNDIVTAPKTLTSTREVYMQDELLDLCRKIKAYTMSECMRNGVRTRLFVCDENGDHVQYYAYNKCLKRTAKNVLGREITSHIMRHTHVALMAEAGVDLETISDRLGHANSKVTREVYMHVTERMKEERNNRIKSVSLLANC